MASLRTKIEKWLVLGTVITIFFGRTGFIPALPWYLSAGMSNVYAIDAILGGCALVGTGLVLSFILRVLGLEKKAGDIVA